MADAKRTGRPAGIVRSWLERWNSRLTLWPSGRKPTRPALDRGVSMLNVAARPDEDGRSPSSAGYLNLSRSPVKPGTGSKMKRPASCYALNVSSRRPSEIHFRPSTNNSQQSNESLALVDIDHQNSQQVELEGRHDHPVMNPSSSLDLWAASLPYIDSDVSDSDDCSYSTRRTCQLEKEPSNEQPAPSKTTDAMMTTTTDPAKGAEEEMTNKAEAEEETFQLPISPAADDISSAGRNPSPALMDCGVYLPGLRHGGKALVVAELALLQEEKNKAVTATDLARLLAHYRSSLVPRKSASKNGLVLLVVGRPEEFPEAFQLIRQLLHYIQNEGLEGTKCIVDDVVIWMEDEGSTTDESLTLSGQSCDVMGGNRQLRERLAGALPLRCCGGAVAHNQRDWIAFRQIVEPFLNVCRERSKILYKVIASVRKTSAPDEPEAVRDVELLRLLADGPRILQDVAAARDKLGDHNIDARETVERCWALYAEVQRSVGRLARVCERRKAQLEKKTTMHLPCTELPSTSAACRQILSWLCRKGEETLSRYNVTLVDSLAAAKAQQREFQRFLNLAQKQIVKGRELLEDLQRDSGTLSPTQEEEESTAANDAPPAPPPPTSAAPAVLIRAKSTSNILDLATSLQSQLSKFGHRLDDTRERLEDTSRCYELLDKAYEWGVEAMKLASKLKLDQQPCPLSVAAHLLQQVDGFLAEQAHGHSAVLEDLNVLARKLDNPKLLDQCKLAQNRCQETLELLEFRRNILADYVKEDELKRQQQHQQKFETDSIIYENVSELMGRNSSVLSEDKVDGGPLSVASSLKDVSVWTKGSSCSSTKSDTESVQTALDANCVLLRVKKNQQQAECQLPKRPASVHQLRGPTYSSAGSSYASSTSSWSSRMKSAACRKMASVQPPSSIPPDDEDHTKDCNKSEKSAAKEEAELEEEEEHVSICQSPISVNSHLQCRSSSVDLSLPIAEMQEAGFSQDDIKSQKTLLLIMREMIQTERDYVRSLEYIIENYIPELSREDIPQAMRGKRNVIFGNIEKIYHFHHHYFLRELERCHNLPFLVGQCFLRHEQHFYLYALYNKNKPKSDSLMAEYGTAFFRRKQAELGDKMDLASYLLKPVQRMGKYALLLKQLLKESGDKEPEFADLMAAEQMVRFQLRHGNDLLAMDSLRDCDVNVKEQGRLLRQSEFYCWQGRKKGLRHVFLFEDLILFSKSKRDPERKNLDIYIYKQSMKTSDIGFTAKMGDSSTRFEIWFRKRKPNETIVMEATHPDVKEAWVEDISRILWKQALRNRELRMAEMAEMGIGNKPCLDIRPSQDQISDRSISYAQLAKAPKFRHSVCGSMLLADSRTSKRPHSIISISSSASSSASSSGSGSVGNDNRTSSNGSSGSSGGSGHREDSSASPSGGMSLANLLSNHRSKTNQSQCSAESGILADLSMSYDDPGDSSGGGGRHCRIGRSDSSITTESADSVTLSPSSPLTSSKSCPYPSSSTSPVSLYVNNKLIPLSTSTPSNKNLPMTEM